MVNRNIRLFPIPMPLGILVFGLYVLLSPFGAFSSEFYLGSSIHSVLLCERCNFRLTDGEEILAICTHIIQYFVLINIAFLGVLTLISLLAFNSWHGII